MRIEGKMTSQTVSFFNIDSNFDIEHQLLSSLNPVLPDPVFIDRLEQRLKREPAIVLEPGSFVKAYIIMISGLVGGVLLLWLLHLVYRELQKLPVLKN
jgi:hypothetical protein